MKLISTVGKVKLNYKNPVVAIGVFDGVHLGHQCLIKKMIARARAIQGTSIVITFSPHPAHVLQPQMKLLYVVTLKHRLKLIEDMGADVCIVLRFTKKFSRLTPEQFIQRYLVGWIRPREIFVGDDFRFGQNRSGDLDLFRREGQRFGFLVHVVPAVVSSGGVVSSTRIRNLIGSGRLTSASRLLGRRFSVYGNVTKGDSRGAKLGFPTANVNLSGDIFPPLGVYAVRVALNNREYYGMANIGIRPSFQNNGRINLEVYIFGFKDDIYGKEIMVEFIKKFREEKEFPSSAALVKQLQKDEQKARRILFELTSNK